MRDKKLFYRLLAIATLIVAIALPQAQAQEKKKESPGQVLIKNVNIFDGSSEKVVQGQDVLVEGKLIKKIGKGLEADKNAIVIDGTGRTMTPGLIDICTST